MSIKWLDTKRIELAGLNYVQSVVNEAGSIFNKVDGTNDIGIDAYIEFINNNSPTGLCVAVQIKAGDSNSSKSGESVVLKTDKNHLEYWYNHILPVIAVIFIPKFDKAYWLDITQFIADNEGIIENGPYILAIPKENIFDVTNFELVNYKLSKYLNSYGDDKFFGRALRLLADEKNNENRNEAIKSLFSFHRNKLETWYFLVTRFCFENDHKVQIALIYAYRHLLTHGDIWWHSGNIIESEISSQAKRLIPQYFTLNEVSKLLNHIDDDCGISRGTIGYDVNLIIKLIPHRVDILKRIILNDDTSDDNRSWAAICLINEFQYHNLDRAINFAKSMYTNYPKSIHVEQFIDIEQLLSDFSEIDFIG